jgi:hypothetical protein
MRSSRTGRPAAGHDRGPGRPGPRPARLARNARPARNARAARPRPVRSGWPRPARPGLLIFAAGLVYLGRGGLATLGGAALVVAGTLGTATISYARQDAASPYTQLLHQEQVVDVIFADIVPRRESVATADSYLRDLGLPASWTRFAGHTFWSKPSVYDSRLYNQYAPRLTDGNLARFLLTHPWLTVRIAQQSAIDAMQLRVTYLGDYAPSAGQPAGSLENRVQVISSVVGVIPNLLGLFWLIPLWGALVALAVITLRRPRRCRWHHDAAVAVIGLVGCAVAAFIPAAFFAGTETTQHMLGSNMATALAFVTGMGLLGSLLKIGLTAGSQPASSRMAVPGPRPAPAELITQGR